MKWLDYPNNIDDLVIFSLEDIEITKDMLGQFATSELRSAAIEIGISRTVAKAASREELIRFFTKTETGVLLNSEEPYIFPNNHDEKCLCTSCREDFKVVR